MDSENDVERYIFTGEVLLSLPCIYVVKVKYRSGHVEEARFDRKDAHALIWHCWQNEIPISSPWPYSKFLPSENELRFCYEFDRAEPDNEKKGEDEAGPFALMAVSRST